VERARSRAEREGVRVAIRIEALIVRNPTSLTILKCLAKPLGAPVVSARVMSSLRLLHPSAPARGPLNWRVPASRPVFATSLPHCPAQSGTFRHKRARRGDDGRPRFFPPEPPVHTEKTNAEVVESLEPTIGLEPMTCRLRIDDVSDKYLPCNHHFCSPTRRSYDSPRVVRSRSARGTAHRPRAPVHGVHGTRAAGPGWTRERWNGPTITAPAPSVPVLACFTSNPRSPGPPASIPTSATSLRADSPARARRGVRPEACPWR
jgi:hypothetical protein